MSLDEALGLKAVGVSDRRDRLFEAFGMSKNPFPPAGQPSGHPHLATAADRTLESAIRSFRDDDLSQVVVIEGEQGVGKTNVLSHYHTELRRFISTKRLENYLVRYYSDPEPSFETVLNTMLQQLGSAFLRDVVEAYGAADDTLRKQVREAIRNQDVLTAILAVTRAKGNEDAFVESLRLCNEWMSGHRLLKRHREVLEVTYRLDTVEAKTQVLRDLIEIGSLLHVVKGVFLLLDELEKQDYTTSKSNVVKFLLSIRALIDALPRHLFLVVALTSVAKKRYFQMVPSVQSRMQRTLTLQSFRSWKDAEPLYLFYLGKAREAARADFPGREPGDGELLPPAVAAACFERRLASSRQVGAEGVSPRDFLDELHTTASARIDAFIDGDRD